MVEADIHWSNQRRVEEFEVMSEDKKSAPKPSEIKGSGVKELQKSDKPKNPNRKERRDKEYRRPEHLTHRPFHTKGLQNLRAALNDTNVNIRTS